MARIEYPELFAVVAPGLEEVALAELLRWRFRKVRPANGGILFRGSPLKANRVLAIPTRILQRVSKFTARTFEELMDGVVTVDWLPYGGITPRATARKSRLYHTGAVEERVRSVVRSGATDLHIRLDRDTCTLSLDTTGERLHRRGWRLENGPAPIRESLASGVLALADWAPGEALVDPMCGAGTFVIEAAVRAAGKVPGAQRAFSCEQWWRTESMPCGEAVATIIAGSDRAEPTLEAAVRNAARAGVEVDLTVASAQALVPPAKTGLLVCNPPYGRRVSKPGKAYDTLGDLLNGPFKDWRGAILCPDAGMIRRLRRPIKARHTLSNGGVKLELVVV